MTTAQTSPKIMCCTRSCLIQIWRLKAECLWFKGKVVQTFLGQSKNACMKISQWLLFSYQLHLCMDDIRRCLSDGYYFLIMNPIQYIFGPITVRWYIEKIFQAWIDCSLYYCNCFCTYILIIIHNQMLGCLLTLHVDDRLITACDLLLMVFLQTVVVSLGQVWGI